MDKIILCFEVSNCQESYSALMQIIEVLEVKKKEADYKALNDMLSARYCWLKGRSAIQFSASEIVRNIEINWNNLKAEKNIWYAHKLSDLKQVVEKKEEYQIDYYIRICNKSEMDIKNIQFLLLILQQFPMLYGRVKVFWEPFENYLIATKENWSNVSSYYKYSHYLRFILERYKNTFYSAFYISKEKQVCIEQLSSKKMGVQSTFFPLIEIDSETFSVFTRYCVWNQEELLMVNEQRQEDTELRDILEISKRILNKRVEEIISRKEERKKYIEVFYKSLSNERVTSLEYAILSILVPIKECITDDEIEVYKERAKSISNGIIQIIENIILHSINHKGVFTFRLVQKGKRFLENILENPSGDYEKVIEIDVADANTYETIIDNFSKKIKSKNYFHNLDLSVSNFFRKFDNKEVELEWERFREENPVKCLGLERLGMELRLSKAILQVRSSTSYRDEVASLTYKENAYNQSDFKTKGTNSYIPGTQFAISLPILHYEKNKQHNANILLEDIGSLKETDKSYASFITYSAVSYESNTTEIVCQGEKTRRNILELDKIFYEQCKRKTTLDNEKDMMVHMWEEELDSWEKQIKSADEKVYYFDMAVAQDFQSPWGIETFCKGFVASNVLHSKKIKYIALINCNSKIVQMMFETILLSESYMGKDVQLYLHNENCLDDLVVIGESKAEIIVNALQYCYAKGNPPDYLKKYAKSKKYNCSNKVELFPFDVVLVEKTTGISLFEMYIEKVAQKLLITPDEAGYLLSDTHMRLGSKVHLSEFYEISILFRKPRISRKIALLIIRRMIAEKVQIDSDLLFYGYASYSKTILTALTEIMKYYHGKNKHFVEYVVYQNDIMVQKTLTHISPKVRMYYSREIPQDKSVNIIQIVPISSTLTTFRKMWDMFIDDRHDCQHQLIKNYTLFWVRDEREKDVPEDKPTEIEEEYWKEILEDRTISTSLINPDPQFFCKRETKWFNPLNCKQCYPDNVLDEKSLIETDVTSTVPSQQLEVQSEKRLDKKEKEHRVINDIRLVNLKDCIYYGHVSRDGNHFQYYVDTMQYFYKQKQYIVKWLENLQGIRKKKGNENVLNILVTPQHHTNVEFVHYVNNYYFNGSADIITIDSAKEYRSNIILKYADVKEAIATAIELKTKVKFIYVDDTIITGATYRRVNNLLHSLVPQGNRKPIQFDEVFVLVNRLSTISRADYVNNVEKDFHTFVDVKISSIRNFGDSCAMCTLQKNSKLFFKRAATAEISRYWNKKKYDYEPIAFDKYAQLKDLEQKKEQGYLRMLCSHYAKEQLDIGSDMKGNIFSLLKLFAEVKKIQEKQIEMQSVKALEEQKEYFLSENVSPIYCCVFKKNIKETIKSYLKVLCRPFFSYGKFYRQSILDLFLILSESFFKPQFDDMLAERDLLVSDNKTYLNDYELRIELRKLCRYLKEVFKDEEERIHFIQDYLMEGLTDLRSNYIIRKNTINNFKRLMKGKSYNATCYRKYERMIHRLVNSSSDETKSLWLEYLLITGEENSSNLNNVGEMEPRVRDTDSFFNSFLDSIFIENTRLYYDSMLNFVKYASDCKEKRGLSEEKAIAQAVQDMWGDYYIRNLRKFVKLEILSDNTITGKDVDLMIVEKVEKMALLLYILKSETASGIERYTKLKKCIEKILYEGDKLQILTPAFEGAKDKEELYAVTDYNKGSISRKTVENVEVAINTNSLKNKSFYVGDNYIILCIDNNTEYLKDNRIEDSALIKIQPLYFYIECNTDNHFHVILRVRKILMYRYQLLHWIEADFNNNTMPILAEQMGINRQLMRERAGDHNSSTDILATEKLLQTKYKSEYQDVYRWLLLKVYVNMRIARLFRCEWTNSYEEVKDKAYTKEQNADVINGPLKNIGDAVWGYTLKGLSPKRYFSFIKDIFCFDIDAFGICKRNASIKEIQEVIKRLNGRCEDGYYYKQEYIICILFDIIFNAIRVCRNWEVDLIDFFKTDEGKLYDSVFSEDELCAHYCILKSSEEKCRICIQVERIPSERIAYLVLKNKVYGKRKESIKSSNVELEDNIASKETVGMSIQAMKWYTETIGGQDAVKAQFFYEWNEQLKQVDFVTKLPIILWEE